MLFNSVLVAALALVSSVHASRSTGCGKAPDVQPGHHHVRTVNSAGGGGSREFIIAVPSTYQQNTSVPLILSFHGAGKDMNNQFNLSDFWNETWNPNAISVYPNGINHLWSDSPDDKDGPNDLVFTHDLLDSLADDYCIDETRVYCSGKSIGGGFCNMLACNDEVSHRFAAIAPVSGAYYTTPAGKPFGQECSPARNSMPVLEFHGLADETINYNGGEHKDVDLRSVPDWAQAWADLDGCNHQGPTNTSLNNGVVTLYEWNCGSIQGENATGPVVSHYAIEGLAHVWPSKGWNPDNKGHGTVIDATPLIVEFFNKHSLSQAPTKRSVQEASRRHARDMK